MTKILERIHSIVWGAPALILIIGVGLYLSVRLRVVQLRLLPRAAAAFCRQFRKKPKDGQTVSSFQAVCTALAATVGTGNLVGVAGAICIGGPGAVFWIWVCGILGMATKFAEATLALRYRVSEGGEYVGGPMYMILGGMGNRWRWLAGLYSFFGVVAAFGVGNATQINAVIAGIHSVGLRFGWEPGRTGDLVLGVLLAALIGAMLMGGARRIGAAAERLVPVAAAGYILLCAGVLILRREAIPAAFRGILEGAFSPRAITGGAVGSAVQALRIGCSRGVFTNEAGMGTASIAHASARVNHPVEQGLMGIMEVFLDTILICTMTALVILTSGVAIPYGEDAGSILTADAFTAVCGDWSSVFLAAALCCFAFATVLGWGLYGARCAQFLFGAGSWKHFVFLQMAVVVAGSVLDTGTVWLLAEAVNGLMAIPNLVALMCLSPELIRLTKEYEINNRQTAGGGTKCRFQSMQTDANPRPCESSTPTRWPRKRRARKSTI